MVAAPQAEGPVEALIDDIIQTVAWGLAAIGLAALGGGAIAGFCVQAYERRRGGRP